MTNLLHSEVSNPDDVRTCIGPYRYLSIWKFLASGETHSNVGGAFVIQATHSVGTMQSAVYKFHSEHTHERFADRIQADGI